MKEVRKEARKEASETRVRSMKKCNTVLASMVKCPGMGIVMRGKEQVAVRQRKIAWMRCCVLGDLHNVMCHIHPTVEALLHHMARCPPLQGCKRFLGNDVM